MNDRAIEDRNENALEAADAETVQADDVGRCDRTLTGVHLMSRADLEAATAGMHDSLDADWDDGGSTSREEAVRQRQLIRWRDDADLLWRDHLIADTATIGRVARLGLAQPNMAVAVEIVRRAAVLSAHASQPIMVPPLVLVGPPGVGKTTFAVALAGALGTTSSIVTGSTLADMGPITGNNTAWRGAKPGQIARSLLGCGNSSPVIVIDEAEKIVAYDDRKYPLDVLLSVLEATTACIYRDNYYDVPLRAQNVIWLFCVNELSGLSQPFLDRCAIIEVPDLSGEQRHRVLEDLVADIVLDYGIVPQSLDAEVLSVLDGLGLRRIRAVVRAAMASSIEAGRDHLTVDDLRDALHLLATGGEPRRARPGFVRF